MKSIHTPLIRKIIILVGSLITWSTLAVVVFLRFSPNLGILGILLNSFIIAISLADLYRHASWVSFLFSTFVFALIGYLLFGYNTEFLTVTAIGSGIFLLTTLLSALFKKRVAALDELFQYQKYLVDSLAVYESGTNLMYWRFAKRALMEETIRSRRYSGELSLVLFEVLHINQYNIDEIQKIEKNMAEIILDVVRKDVDIPFISDRIGIILPERDPEYAKSFTNQIIKIVETNLNASIAAGIANFPNDAETAQELIIRAERALQTALNTGQPVVLYQTLTAEYELANGKSHPDLSDETTKPIEIHARKSPTKYFIKVLENIPFNDSEWIIWLEGFNQMEDLIHSNHNLLNIEHIMSIEFIFVQVEYLVVKVKTYLTNLEDNEQPFPGWEILKINPYNHYILMRQA